MEEAKEIGIAGIGNYYGGLRVKEDKNKYYWAIENYDGLYWEEINKTLYDELLKHKSKGGHHEKYEGW